MTTEAVIGNLFMIWSSVPIISVLFVLSRLVCPLLSVFCCFTGHWSTVNFVFYVLPEWRINILKAYSELHSWTFILMVKRSRELELVRSQRAQDSTGQFMFVDIDSSETSADRSDLVDVSKGAITSKIKHAIKLKTSPARLAQCTTIAAFISILF